MNSHEKHDRPERKSVHERTLDAPLLNFSIREKIEELKNESEWKQGDRNAITLQKNDDLRVVLMSVRKGTVLQEHRADGPITVFVVSGKMDFITEGKRVSMETNDIVVLEKPMVHRVEAHEETHFLLTVILPKQEL